MKVKIKIWLEDNKDNLVFGGGKTQILEYIDQTGSISQAAQRVGMNYKKAWTHIKILQEFIDDELVIVNKGRNSGGTTLTPKAKEIMEKYKQLEDEIKNFSLKRFEEIFLPNERLLHCSKERENV